MSQARTNARRRRQAVNDYTHLARLGRPIYGKRSAEAAARRLREVIATERRMSQGKKKK